MTGCLEGAKVASVFSSRPSNAVSSMVTSGNAKPNEIQNNFFYGRAHVCFIQKKAPPFFRMRPAAVS
jgi:hypothetical protein